MENRNEDFYINNNTYLINHDYKILKRKINNINFQSNEIEVCGVTESISKGTPILIKTDDNFKIFGIYKVVDDDSYFGSLIIEPIKEFIKLYEDSILIIYKSYKKLNLKLFHEKFVEDSGKNCQMIIKGKKSEIKDILKLEKNDSKKIFLK